MKKISLILAMLLSCVTMLTGCLFMVDRETESEVSEVISDEEGKIFTEVRPGMTRDKIRDILGHTQDDRYEYMLYKVSSISELDSYCNLFDGRSYGEYKYFYSLDFDNDHLWQYTIRMEGCNSSDVPKILNYMRNTVTPNLKKDYSGLKESKGSSGDYVFYADSDAIDERIVITLDKYLCDDGLYNMEIEITDFDYYDSNYGSGSSGNYDKSDKYYRNNDSNNDGYINDEEFQNAVGDFMDDNGY